MNTAPSCICCVCSSGEEIGGTSSGRIPAAKDIVPPPPRRPVPPHRVSPPQVGHGYPSLTCFLPLYLLSAVLVKHWLSHSPPGGCSWLSPHVVCWTFVPGDALTAVIVGALLITKRWSLRRTTTTKTETASVVQCGWVWWLCVSAGQPLWMFGFQMA